MTITYVKYPKTFHLPWSLGLRSDDKRLKDLSRFINQEVVVTEKVDGENCLDEHTLITTPYGKKTIREICEINYKGLVLSKNLVLNVVEWQNVEFCLINNPGDNWYEIELENGEILQITGDQLVWLPELKCYRKVCELNGTEKIELKK